MVLVTSTNLLFVPPVMLKILKSCFIAVNVPSAKQCNYSLIYSLKVSPLHLPIFCISLSMYPASDSALAPPDINEWVSTLSIGIPFKYGQFNVVVENFNDALMFSALRYFLMFPTQYADKYVFLLLNYFLVDTHRLPNSLIGLKFSSSLCSW